MNLKNNFKILGLILLLFVVQSCLTKTAGDDHGHDHGSESNDHHEHGHGHDEYVHFSKKQIETVGLEFGELQDVKMIDYIKSTGTLGLPPNAFASVNAKVEGIITGNKKYVEGDHITQGKVIAYIENSDFIDDQQDYLEAKANLYLKKLDLERQKTLMDANAGIERDLQSLDAEVSILNAKVNGLKKRLNYLGLDAEKLNAENISQKIAIIAPMSGFISSINLHRGMFAEKNKPLMEIIADDHIHLELDIFEKDISNIKIGQRISYSVPALGTETYDGEISVIGKEFNHRAKTIRVHGHLEGEKPQFIKDLFVTAKIWLNDATVKAVPEDAVIKDESAYYIYVASYDPEASETSFERIEVIPSNSEDGLTPIKLMG
ncbi:MAG: cobalt-zinc-cadmium efflux system membrane fusion protein, partial [Flavobacteriales bacterium]